jgi:hypothetical protein
MKGKVEGGRMKERVEREAGERGEGKARAP